MKLPDENKACFVRIPPPPQPPMHNMGGGASASAKSQSSSQTADAEDPHQFGIHPGVECDKSGQCPIRGIRYNLKGHDYDLCQVEFDKLSSTEKLLYTPIPPPVYSHEHGRPWNFGRGGGHGFGFGRGPWAGANRGGCPFNSNAAGNNNHNNNKLAARFVRDVTVFDGTQMAPSTNFTKIWRLKNTGEQPWPPGTRMLFVGGDRMTDGIEMSVPLSRAGPVMPGEEVDVAVEMVAPPEFGRYLGYWRLMGPRGRKFGQRVWCHVQVVDPSAPEGGTDLSTASLDKTMAEIAKKKSDLASADAEPADEDDATVYAGASTVGASDTGEMEVMQDGKQKVEEHDLCAVATALSSTTLDPPTTAAEVSCGGSDAQSEDGMVLVTEADVAAATPSGTAPVAVSNAMEPEPVLDTKPMCATTNTLEAMGFTDKALIEAAIVKHGDDIAACAASLTAINDWDQALDDLEEMGFPSRDLNKVVMLQNDGNLKRTVKALVEEA